MTDTLNNTPAPSILALSPGRLWQRVRAESILAILYPRRDSLFLRYERYRRFGLFLILYNTAIVYLVLWMNHAFIDFILPQANAWGVNPSRKIVYYFEGLVRYVLWTAANFRLVYNFRRSFDASLYLTGISPGLEMALYFARAFFIASILGSCIYHAFHGSYLFEHELGRFLKGIFVTGIIAEETFRRVSRFFLHEVGLAIFRSAAVAYALFGGRRMARSLFRAFIGYAMGALFLFSLYHWAEVNYAGGGGIIPRRISPVPMLVWLVPYYLTCFLGAEFFLHFLRRQGRRAAQEDFETM